MSLNLGVADLRYTITQACVRQRLVRFHRIGHLDLEKFYRTQKVLTQVIFVTNSMSESSLHLGKFILVCGIPNEIQT